MRYATSLHNCPKPISGNVPEPRPRRRGTNQKHFWMAAAQGTCSAKGPPIDDCYALSGWPAASCRNSGRRTRADDDEVKPSHQGAADSRPQQ
jgi:hypothetical protein